eukprot:6488546-Amphidinium_carterae.1
MDMDEAETYVADGNHYYEGSAAWYDESSYAEEADSDCTGTEQWEEEARLDPWPEERLTEEYRKGRNPTYLAKCYWAARKAIRKFRAAGGRFQRRGFRRKFKGKGKGKDKASKGGKAKGSGVPLGGKAKHGILPKGAYYEDEPTLTWTADDYHNYDNDYDTYYNPSEYPWTDGMPGEENYFKGKSSHKKGAKGTSGKSAQKGTSGACHICGQMGHWKNECPQKAMFTEENHSEQAAAATQLFHTEAAQHNTPPLFWANEDDQ